jgi:hypothetical protein
MIPAQEWLQAHLEIENERHRLEVERLKLHARLFESQVRSIELQAQRKETMVRIRRDLDRITFALGHE